jgi:hypothetical protein
MTDHGVIFSKTGRARLLLKGFSDADMAGDIDGRKSTSSVCLPRLISGCMAVAEAEGGGVVDVRSRLHRSGATAACQGVCGCIGCWASSSGKNFSTLMVDNQPAIALAKNPILHDRSNHVDIKYQFLRDCVERRQIVLEFVEIGQQVADILTKPLGCLRFSELKDKIGMVEL